MIKRPTQRKKLSPRINVVVNDDLLAIIDRWRQSQIDKPGRAEALRRAAAEFFSKQDDKDKR